MTLSEAVAFDAAPRFTYRVGKLCGNCRSTEPPRVLLSDQRYQFGPFKPFKVESIGFHTRDSLPSQGSSDRSSRPHFLALGFVGTVEPVLILLVIRSITGVRYEIVCFFGW